MSKMNFESLKDSKFGAFESHKLDNPLQVCGGEMHATTYSQYEGTDGGKTFQLMKKGVDRFDFGEGQTRNDPGFPSTGAGDLTFTVINSYQWRNWKLYWPLSSISNGGAGQHSHFKRFYKYLI